MYKFSKKRLFKKFCLLIVVFLSITIFFSSCGYSNISIGQEYEINLKDAIEIGNLELAKESLHDGASPDCILKSKDNPLYLAMSYSRYDIFDYLLEFGADPDYVDERGISLICYAAGYKRPGVNPSSLSDIHYLKYFVDKGANINALTPQGLSALDVAMQEYKANIMVADEIISLLIESDVNVTDKTASVVQSAIEKMYCSYNTVLFLCENKGLSLEFSKCIKASTAKEKISDYSVFENVQEYELKNALFFSAAKNDINAVKYLIEKKGLSVNITDSISNSILMLAVKNKADETIEYLISNGADLNIINFEDKTALCYAIDNNDVDNAKRLVESGADTIIEKEAGSFNGLNNAIITENENMVNLMTEKTDVDKSIAYEAIIQAAHNKDTKIISFLMEKDIFKEIVEKNKGYILNEILFSSEKTEAYILQFFIDNGCDVNGNDIDFTPLALASGDNNLSAVKCLVENGAEINTKSSEVSYTPLGCAIESGNMEVVKYLVENGAIIDGDIIELAVEAGSKNILNYLEEKNKTEIPSYFLR